MLDLHEWLHTDLLDERAATTPDRTAVIDSETRREWSFSELNTAVDDLAGRLASLGVTAGDHLGMLLETSVDGLQLIHAAMRLGAVLVPLNTRVNPETLSAQTEKADVQTLVCNASTVATAATLPVDVIASMDDIDQSALPSLEQESPQRVDPIAWDHDDLTVLMFTSGTTGNPKAVQLTAGNLLANALASSYRLGTHPSDRWLVCLPLYHLGGYSPIIRTALAGTGVVVQPAFDREETTSLISSYDVTGVSLVPTLLNRLVAEDWQPPDTFRFVLLGGAPASTNLIRRCERLDIPVCPTYGATETASQIATARPAEAYANPGTVGRPLLWTTVTIQTEGTSAPPGTTGEVVVSGPTVSPGYYRHESESTAGFDQDGFHTGDVGYVDADGYLYIIGRQDEMIITGGENVHPAEVTAVLESHPEVTAAAVVGIDDETWGQQIAAIVVPHQREEHTANELTVDDLRAYCQRNLADFKCPKTIQFVSSLPRTPSGTIDRDTVRARLATESTGGDSHPSED